MKHPRCLFALAAISLGVSAPAKNYDLIDLGTPDPSFFSFNVKINNVGTLAVTAVGGVTEEPERAFVYYAGTYTPIPNPTPWAGSTAADINDENELVGFFYFGGYDFTKGYVYDADTASLQIVDDLTGLTGTTAYGINNASQILGDLTVLQYQAWVYDPATGTTTDVDEASGISGIFALDINDAGQLLLAAPPQQYYLYTLSTDALDPIPAPPWPSAFYRINDVGTVAGSTAGAFGSASAVVLFENGSFTRAEAPGPFVQISEIDNRGFVVGSFGPPEDRRAFLYNSKKVLDLNSRVPRGKLRGWTLRAATDINDLGQIVGYMTNESGEAHIFLLNPRPRPRPSAAGQ